MLLIKTWLPKCFLVRHMLGLSFWKAEFCTTNLCAMTSLFHLPGKGSLLQRLQLNAASSDTRFLSQESTG